MHGPEPPVLQDQSPQVSAHAHPNHVTTKLNNVKIIMYEDKTKAEVSYNFFSEIHIILASVSFLFQITNDLAEKLINSVALP